MTFTQKEKSEEKSSNSVSLFNLTIYTKFLRKGWLLGILPGLVMFAFGLLMFAIWPEFELLLINNPAFNDLLDNPIYQALLGGATDMSTYQGFFTIELYTVVEFLMLFLAVFLPVRIISIEVEKNTLDIALSYPIPRWHFLAQKYLVYLSQMIFIPIAIIISAVVTTEGLNYMSDEGLIVLATPAAFNYEGLILSAFAMFLLFFSLGALSLLAAALFLESGRSLTVAGILCIGMWIFNSIGGLVETLNFLQDLSFFHYLKTRVILDSGVLEFNDFFIVAFTGLLALIAACYIFNRRELAY
ncbi:MAG: ABC transporter permease subunit [Candidatus Hodarchaeales archaeon]|jgi:ABC-type transport system involved in multi-copper enzyme maturation permease subunit